MKRRLRRGMGIGISALLLSAPLAGLALAPAAQAAPDPGLASGPDWTVERAAGGYLVTVELSEPLPIRSDAPTIVVDGETVGIATEAGDGRSLSVFTTDASVVKASSVDAGWASQSESGTAAAQRSAVEVPDAAAPEPLDADPSSIGSYEWTESVYKFGDQAIPLSGIGGIRGELEGKMYLPTTGGARPTVILLHGRHSSCYGTGPSNPLRWPCATSPDNTDRKSIPSYAGYDGTARALASHGYSVVSISANAVNSNDNELAADQGAQARGQLILDTLSMLDDANAGDPVTYYDAWTARDVTLAQALEEGTTSYTARAAEGFVGTTRPLDTVVPGDLVGRFDLSTIGLMGHSRGGEGVTSAATLNQGLEDPWDIESILPLAPVDFGRMTVPDVPMNVMLPYCDGDVSNQQGQHMLDDSRYAFGDDVLRSGVWAMGANHNFYNTVWTPGKYSFSTSDDWSGSSTRRVDPVCGTDPSVAETSIRMTADEQYAQGTAYMAGWFRLTLGGEDQFLPMFDGSGQVPAVLDGEDVRSVSTGPAGERATVTSFERATSQVRASGTATINPCASLSGRTTPQDLPPCASTLASAQVPHWTPASNGGNVPATPVSRMSWTSSTGEVRISVPKAERDASGFDRLSVKMAADETVPTGTDLRMTVVDGESRTWSGLVSELNPLALVRLPTSTSTAAATTLKKVVLQQVNVPTSTLADAGLELDDLREVRLTAAQGLDGTANGAAYLSDLAFESSSVGTPVTRSEPVIDVYAPKRAEGDGPDTFDLAAYLEEPATVPVTGYVSLLGSSTSRAGATMEKVTFAPGETCAVVPAALQGDNAPSSTAATTVKASVINTSGAVMGKQAILNTSISEDDGITSSAQPAPAYGEPGPVCEELEGVLAGGTVETADSATPGEQTTASAAGFRPGESVRFSGAGIEPVSVIADETGLATATLLVSPDAAAGPTEITAVGAGTGRTATGELVVVAPSTTTLTLDPEVPELREPVTLTATVDATGDADGGTVEFFDGDTSLGSDEVEDGVAELEVEGFGAGEHSLTAVFSGTDLVAGSTSTPVVFTVARGATSVVLTLSEPSTVFGKPATVDVAVGGGADEGEVEITYGGESVTVPVDDTGHATHELPATLPAGSYTVTAQYLGTEDFEESEPVGTPYEVTRKKTSTSLTAPQRADRGGTFTVVVTVGKQVEGAPATGRLTLRIAGAASGSPSKALPASGTVRFEVRAPRSGQQLRLRAVYAADGSYAGSSSATRVVRLR